MSKWLKITIWAVCVVLILVTVVGVSGWQPWGATTDDYDRLVAQIERYTCQEFHQERENILEEINAIHTRDRAALSIDNPRPSEAEIANWEVAKNQIFDKLGKVTVAIDLKADGC